MANPFKKYSIDYLFFGSFAVLIVVILGATIWTSYSLTSRELAETTSVNQRKLLDELNSEIVSRLATVEQLSLSTSRDSRLLAFLATGRSEDEFDRLQQFKEIQQSLANLTYSIPLIQSIDLYMNDPLFGDSQSYIRFHPVDEAPRQIWYGSIKQSDFAWSAEHVIHSSQGDVAVLSFARTMYANNRNLGYLVIHAKAEALKELLSGHSSNVNRIMLDSFGRTMLKIGGEPAPAGDDWKAKLKGGSGVFRIHDRPGDSGRLIVYSRISNSDWMMVETSPWSAITQGSLRLAAAIAAIGAAAIVLALFLTLYISRQFAKPIKRLVTAMNRYSVEGGSPELPGDYENEFGYLFAGYRRQNERIDELVRSLRQRHEQQRRAELEALQANINPHFLYNTLDQLNWMAITAGQEEMSRMLELVGKMFRIGLAKGESFITVAEELEHLNCYLEIQRLRGSLNLDCDLHVPPQLLGRFVPKMMLQPLVENAVVHGFHLRERGRLDIRMAQAGRTLTVTVEDDGIGIGETPKPPGRKTGGYGIRNVKERISAYFGDECGLTIAARQEGGTRVIITLPILEEPAGLERIV